MRTSSSRINTGVENDNKGGSGKVLPELWVGLRRLVLALVVHDVLKLGIAQLRKGKAPSPLGFSNINIARERHTTLVEYAETWCSQSM